MQDSQMQIKAQASQLCKMLSKPENQRMPFQGVEIAKSLQRVTFLSKFFDMKSQQFINLCITSRILQFNSNTDIYSKQSNRYIYIILEGKVKVTLKNEQSQIFQSSKHYLSQFGIFGQTEILFGLKQRKETITTQNTIVKCMIFQEKQIRKLISPKMIDFIDRSLKYLHVNEYFQELNEFEKEQLITYLSLKTFSKMDHIIQKGEQINYVLFFVYGRVSVIKEMELKNLSQKKTYKIDELSQMDSFGEYECFNKKLTSHSLIAESTGAYYSLDYKGLKNSNHKILSIIKQNAIPYPDQEELGFLKQVENNLKMQQQKVVRKNKLF